MHIHHLQTKHSVLNHFVAEIRDLEVQADRMRFRRNIERIGEILAYELSTSLDYTDSTVQTPLGKKTVPKISDEMVLCSVLRAGLPLHQGILNYFDGIDNAFISAFRKHSSPEDFEIEVEYLASPELRGKTLILADPMLATGKSLVAVTQTLEKLGPWKEIHFVAVIASKEGIANLSAAFPDDSHLWVAAVDDELNAKGYIVPGLGDAGDLAFGDKL